MRKKFCMAPKGRRRTTVAIPSLLRRQATATQRATVAQAAAALEPRGKQFLAGSGRRQVQRFIETQLAASR